MSLRKIIKTRGSFPSEEAALKLLYLSMRNVSVKWDAIQHWRQALNHFQTHLMHNCAHRSATPLAKNSHTQTCYDGAQQEQGARFGCINKKLLH
jgi:hypothetical protein